MRIATHFRYALAALAAAGLTAAQAAAQSPLTLDDAVARALKQNPATRGAEAARREASERSRQARAGWLPRLDLTETWQRGNQPVFVFGSILAQRSFTEANFAIDALNHPDPVSNFRTGISVDQLVFDGVRTRSANRSAAIGEEIADAGSRDTAAMLRLGATTAFGEVLMAQANRAAAAAALESAEEDVRRAERRRDAGLATEADVLAVKVHLAQIRERQIGAASRETVARLQLNQLMGEPLDARFELQPPSPAEVAPPPMADLEAEALANRPDVARAAAQERLARESITAARSGFYPQAAVQGVYEFNGGTFADRASAWTVGAVLRWNIFGGFADSARLGEAKAATERARAERDRQESAARVDVRTAVARLEDARARVEVGRLTVAQARESQRIVRDRFDAGLAPVNDLLRSAMAVLDADSHQTAAAIDVLISAALLERARGR
ncbi:MAG: TolC family protein [Vicinamibacterales bacterium]|jgi:outer membrane protein TolC|nr:TolC family protein [Vicinamibacterales bacterium]